MEPPVPSGTSETSRTGTRIEMLERPHSVTRSSAIAMIGAIVPQCLRLVVVVYVARRFSSAQFGSFSFAMAVNAYVFVVAHFGLPLYGARAVAKAGRVSLRLVPRMIDNELQEASGVVGTPNSSHLTLDAWWRRELRRVSW